MSTTLIQLKQAMQNALLETKTDQDIAPRGLRAFREHPFPKAADIFPNGENNICIYAINAMDGVGDFMHLLSFGQDTRKLASPQGYGVIGMLVINTNFSTLSDPAACEHAVLKAIGKQLTTHCFDRLYVTIFTNAAGKIDVFTGERQLAEDPQPVIDVLSKQNPKNVIFQTSLSLSQSYVLDCKNACLVLNIISLAAECAPPPFRTSVQTIYINEYGCSVNNDILEENKAPMGLVRISQTNDCFGIKLHDLRRRTIAEKAERLCTFENKHFVQLLLNTENPSVGLAEGYFSKAVLLPGYLQSYVSSAIFIASHAYKYLDENGILTKNCDFFLNGKFVDRLIIVELLKRLNICSVSFISPDTTLQSLGSHTCQIRVFCNFFLEDNDYRDLYSLTEGGAACSGDNSCSNVFSSENIPFAMALTPASIFLSKFWRELHHFIGDFKKSEESNERHLEKLYTYFSRLCVQDFSDFSLTKEVSAKYRKLFLLTMKRLSTDDDLRRQHTEESLRIGAEKVALKTTVEKWELSINRYVELSKKIGAFLRDPELQQEWKTFREMLAKEYNYSKNYEDFILKGALYVGARKLCAANSSPSTPLLVPQDSSLKQTLPEITETQNNPMPASIVFSKGINGQYNGNTSPVPVRRSRDPMGLCFRLA